MEPLAPLMPQHMTRLLSFSGEPPSRNYTSFHLQRQIHRPETPTMAFLAHPESYNIVNSSGATLFTSHVSFSYVNLCTGTSDLKVEVWLSVAGCYELGCQSAVCGCSGDKWNQVKPQMGGSCRS